MSKEIKENENEILIKILNEENNTIKISNNFIRFLHKKQAKNICNNQRKSFRIKKNSTVAALKMIISDIENISSEKIHLFFLDNKSKIKEEENKINFISLKKINQDFLEINNSSLEELRDIDYFNSIKKRLNINTFPILYYSTSNLNINKYLYSLDYVICIIVDFYQQNIDKIIFNLGANCSLFLLKNIISNKLNYTNNINIEQIKLFCMDVTEINERNNLSTNIKNQEKSFQDWNNLDNIIDYFYPKEISERNGYKYNIHFFLTIVNELKMCEQIGLNFRFNYLKEISKISFDEKAPDYCECSDGINLFIFCLNQGCCLFDKYFVINIGYGIFNILKQLDGIKCPKCNNGNIVLKNIGIINSKYYYKGILKTKNKTKSIIEGDNTTLDEKLYIFKEAKINSFLDVLFMQAKPHFVFQEKNSNLNKTKEDEELDDIYLNNNNIKSNGEKQITINLNENSKTLREIKNSNKIKIYDNESDLMDKKDIIIDDIDSNILEKVNCVESPSLFYPFCFYGDDYNKEQNSKESIYTDKLSVCEIF